MSNLQIKDLVSATPTSNDLIPISQNGNTRKSTIKDIRGVVNDLTTGGTDVPLSAEMGKDIETEISNARGGEVDLYTRINKIDSKVGNLTSLPTTDKSSLVNAIKENTTSITNKADKSSLDNIALYNATCAYAGNVFTLTLSNAPATLPNFYTVRFKAPSPWIDGSTVVIGSKTYTVANASFVQDEVTTVNFDEVASKCFFKSGGGILDTLPMQVSTFTATSGDTVLNFAWSVSDSSYLSGFYLAYKQGSTPSNVNDGIKIDITNPSATSQQVTGVTNGLSYTGRIFPYNSKKQAQTAYKVASATPVAGKLISSLSVGAKLTVGSYNFIVADINHSGYPSNSVTLLLETTISNQVFDSSNSNRFSTSSIKTWLNSTFIGYLTTLGSNILDTTITTALYGGGSETTTVKAFLVSNTELGLTNENSIAEGVKLSYFNTYSKGITGIYQWLRTPYTGQAGYVHFIDGAGTIGSDTANVYKAVRPLLNVSGNTVISQTANASGYYTLM